MLEEATTKLEGFNKQVNNKDITRKDEEIKRLKEELKTAREGSRMITDHSNKVISESARYRIEAETLV